MPDPIQELSNILAKSNLNTTKGRIEFSLRLEALYNALKFSFIKENVRLDKQRSKADDFSFGAEEILEFGARLLQQAQQELSSSDWHKLQQSLATMEEQFSDVDSLEFRTVGKSGAANATININKWLNKLRLGNITDLDNFNNALHDNDAKITFTDQYKVTEPPQFTLDNKEFFSVDMIIKEELTKIDKTVKEMHGVISSMLEKVKSYYNKKAVEFEANKKYEVANLFRNHLVNLEIEANKWDPQHASFKVTARNIKQRLQQSCDKIIELTDTMLAQDNIQRGENSAFVKALRGAFKAKLPAARTGPEKLLQEQKDQIKRISNSLK